MPLYRSIGHIHLKFKGCKISFICFKFTKGPVLWQTVLTLIRSRVLWHLIWVHTAFQCPTNAFGQISFKLKGYQVLFIVTFYKSYCNLLLSVSSDRGLYRLLQMLQIRSTRHIYGLNVTHLLISEYFKLKI